MQTQRGDRCVAVLVQGQRDLARSRERHEVGIGILIERRSGKSQILTVDEHVNARPGERNVHRLDSCELAEHRLLASLECNDLVKGCLNNLSGKTVVSRRTSGSTSNGGTGKLGSVITNGHFPSLGIEDYAPRRTLINSSNEPADSI